MKCGYGYRTNVTKMNVVMLQVYVTRWVWLRNMNYGHNADMLLTYVSHDECSCIAGLCHKTGVVMLEDYVTK